METRNLMDGGERDSAGSETGAAIDGKPGTTVLRVGGMTCSNCARRVSEVLQAVPGVSFASVALEAGRVTVEWSEGGERRSEALVAAVKGAGFEAEALDTVEAGEEGEGPVSLEAAWKFQVIFGAVCVLPLMFAEWVLGVGHDVRFQWVAFSLATPVMVVCGSRFFRGAWSQLRSGGANMDTLVSLGSATAYGYSATALLLGWGGHLYFMEAGAIILFVSAGHWLESLATARAADALASLLQLAPDRASRLGADGAEQEVAVHELRPGDRVVLRPGDRVPVDGTVIEGASAVDESMLTGESMPVEKPEGATVYTGTLNESGRLVVEVRGTGSATALAGIITAVGRAQSSRADIQRLGDRVSAVFVPVVVVVAVLTGLAWGFEFETMRSMHRWFAGVLWSVDLPETALAAAIAHAAAVLIIACPCAMGLATPAAIMAGANVAARRGILIRDGRALEKSGRITMVLFDKTGTLTVGKPVVGDWDDRRPSTDRATPLAWIAGGLAASSKHPLSRAITGSTPEVVAVDDTVELRGRGLEGSWRGARVRLGSAGWLAETGVELDVADAWVEDQARRGATVLGLAAERRLLGWVALRDALKPGARGVLASLSEAGLKCAVVSGDSEAAVRGIAGELGVTEVFAGVRPEEKAGIVRGLQSRGERVAFVGDGINDAPALEQADLGIAVSRASDVAREAADIILLRSDLEGIPEAIGLARATLRTIKQNLFWAFFYNAAAVPLAVAGLVSPAVCALAMGASDLIVVGNALRLRRWKGNVEPGGARSIARHEMK